MPGRRKGNGLVNDTSVGPALNIVGDVFLLRCLECDHERRVVVPTGLPTPRSRKRRPDRVWLDIEVRLESVLHGHAMTSKPVKPPTVDIPARPNVKPPAYWEE